MNAIATNGEPVKLQEGYYVGGTISGPNTPMPNVEYIHHIHSMTTATDSITNNSLSVNSVSSPYPDSYAATASGGCFTSGRYTSHTHTSCAIHHHKGNSKSGGGCYTKETTSTSSGHVNEWSGWEHWYDNGDGTEEQLKTLRCKYCKKSSGVAKRRSTKDEIEHDYNGTNEQANSKCKTRTITTYELGCGYNEGSYECGGRPYNSNYRYFKSCKYSAGQVVKAIITY